MITTTGLLATPMENDSEFQYDTFHGDHISTLFDGHSGSNANSFSFGERVPLFSLRNNLSMGTYDVSEDHMDLPGWAMNVTGD